MIKLRYSKRKKGCEIIMRFIGNKTKLLDEIEKLLIDKKLNKRGIKFCDLFAGTCTVGDHFKDRYEIIANDTLYICRRML